MGTAQLPHILKQAIKARISQVLNGVAEFVEAQISQI